VEPHKHWAEKGISEVSHKKQFFFVKLEIYKLEISNYFLFW